MSPTQTWPRPAGARASSSVAGPDQRVTPTVRPVSRSTVKIRALSPESLTVTTRPSATTRPLDSMISGSAKRNTTSPSRSAATEAPTRNGVMMTTAAMTLRKMALHELGQLGPDRPRRDQVVVLLADATALHPTSGAHRAQHRVARRVLALHELDHVDAIADQTQDRGTQGIGERVGEALAEDAVPGEEGVRRRRGVA